MTGRQRLKTRAMSGGQLISPVDSTAHIEGSSRVTVRRSRSSAAAREGRDRRDGRRTEGAAGTTSASSTPPGCRQCAGCGAIITDRFLLRAVSKFWHEECLRCGACSCRLGEVGTSLYEKADLILCRRDYLRCWHGAHFGSCVLWSRLTPPITTRLFGSSGHCAACSKPIPAFELVMRARQNVYHLECFACGRCSQRFCVGDRYYLHDGQILCELDYEERQTLSLPAPLPAISPKRGAAAESESSREHQSSAPTGSRHQHPCSVH